MRAWRVHELGEPAKVKSPSLVFVCSMSDLYHTGVKGTDRSLVFEAMKAANPRRSFAPSSVTAVNANAIASQSKP